MTPLAFYAPLKSPDHPDPSGDRTVARLYLRALERAGFAPALASRLRTFEPFGDASRQAALRAASAAEADRILSDIAARPQAERPRAWFTYHCHYKAPDWLGPAVASRLGIPYLVAEGTRAPKRAGGPWALGHVGSEAALDSAAAIFVPTPRDRETLERLQPRRQRLVDLPPFLDVTEWPARTPRARSDKDPLRFVTVAMMRRGDKLASYAVLAGALSCLPAPAAWHIDLIGDGPARADVEAMFAPFGARATFHGRIDERPALAALYAAADLCVWPAVNEAYGMALLEAQACGCPVLAGDGGGVASAMAEGRTGLIARPGDAASLAAAMAGLVGSRGRLAAMGREAGRFALGERSLEAAAAILRAEIGALHLAVP